MAEKSRFSKSNVWKYQRAFYDEKGPDAWNEVPYYVTCNTQIANAYANIIVRFLQDSIAKEEKYKEETFYIIELGAGLGNFGFHVLNKLAELKSKLGLLVKTVYVMTDFVKKNIASWNGNPSFQPFLNNNTLDFAQFDIENIDEINLLHSEKKLNSTTLTTPLMVIGNYVFDTLPCDIFRAEKKILFQGVTDIAYPETPLKNNLDESEIIINYEKADLPYYNIEAYDNILGYYKEQVDQCHFTFPIAALRCIRHLLNIASNRACFIISDKGHYNLLNDDQDHTPGMVLHGGSFSMTVNFHAIARYFKEIRGAYFNPSLENELNTSVYIAGFNSHEIPETKLAAETFLDTFSPSHLYRVHDCMLLMKSNLTLSSIRSFLEITLWEPTIFNSLINTILEIIRQGKYNISEAQNLFDMIRKIENNVFQVKNMMNTYFNLGLFCYELNRYDRAIYYYKKSMSNQDEKDSVYYNLGLCYYHQNEIPTALEMFKKALALNPKYISARGWISQLSEASGIDQPALIS